MSRRRDPEAWNPRDRHYKRGLEQGRAAAGGGKRKGCPLTMLTLPWLLLVALWSAATRQGPGPGGHGVATYPTAERHPVEPRHQKHRRAPGDYAEGYRDGLRRGGDVNTSPRRSQLGTGGKPPRKEGCPLTALLLPWYLLRLLFTARRDGPKSGPAGGSRAGNPKHRGGEWHVDRDDEGPDPDQDARARSARPGVTRHRGEKK